MMSNIIQGPIEFLNPRTETLPELVAASMRRAIQDGRLTAGQQLPAEPELAQQLRVSRTTLRDAVRILVSEGTLQRRRGVGTFVSTNPLVNISEGLELLSSTTNVIRSQGYEPGTSQSSFESVPASVELAQALNVEPGALLWHFSRTRTASGRPVIHCEEYVPADLLPADGMPADAPDWSLYRALAGHNLAVTSAVCKILPVIADERLANCLHVSPKHPLLLLRQTHYAAGNQPVLYCENYHNSAIIEFHIIRRS
jgi:GntR family transcriptional regulator